MTALCCVGFEPWGWVWFEGEGWGGQHVLEGFFVEVGPVADAEAVHDAGVDELEGVGGVGPGDFGAVVDFELWLGRVSAFDYCGTWEIAYLNVRWDTKYFDISKQHWMEERRTIVVGLGLDPFRLLELLAVSQ